MNCNKTCQIDLMEFIGSFLSKIDFQNIQSSTTNYPQNKSGCICEKSNIQLSYFRAILVPSRKLNCYCNRQNKTMPLQQWIKSRESLITLMVFLFNIVHSSNTIVIAENVSWKLIDWITHVFREWLSSNPEIVFNIEMSFN